MQSSPDNDPQTGPVTWLAVTQCLRVVLAQVGNITPQLDHWTAKTGPLDTHNCLVTGRV